MKKLLLVLALAILGNFAIAQNSNVQSALSFQRQAQQLIETADSHKAVNNEKSLKKAAKYMNDAKIVMQRAKDAIDKAAVNEETSRQGKTWHYYSVVYYKIGAYPEFYDLDPEAYVKVLDAVQKVYEYDPNYFKQVGQELATYVKSIGNSYYQLGVDSFNNGNYEDAMLNFQKASDALAKMGAVDDAAMVNIATCALKLKKYDVAAQTYEQLIKKGFDDVANYSGLINAYRELGEGEKAIAALDAAKAKYKDEPVLINDMINTYLTLHREGEIIGEIEAMAVRFPDQPVYYFILGTIFGNKDSELYDIEKALEYYEKAIAENPNYADAYYNAGSLLIDKAAEIYEQSNNLKENDYPNLKAFFAATDAMTKEGKSYDERALPYVEKTHELLPDDLAVKQALKGIYGRLNMLDKAKAIE